MAERWGAVEIASGDTLQETNELFLDTTMNYRKVKQFKHFLKDIYEEAEQLEVENSRIIEQWKKFCKEFEVYDILLENCMVAKIFTSCFRENIDELILEYQLIVTQFLMIRHSAFLRSIIGTTGDKSEKL